MKYAVIVQSGKQYKVKPGDIIEVDRLEAAQATKIVLPEVLLYVNEDKVEIGTPFVKEVTIAAKVLEHKKGEKIRVAKFKAKARYRKVIGFRPYLTKLQIETIGETGEQTTVKPVKTVTAKTVATEDVVSEQKAKTKTAKIAKVTKAA